MPELVFLADQLLAPVPGGTGRYSAELLRALVATIPDGWRLTTVISRGNSRDARLQGLPEPRALGLPRPVLARAWARGLPPGIPGDALHAPTPLAPLGVWQRAPAVVTVHDAVPFTHPETLTPRGAAWHQRMIRRAARHARALVVPTHAVAAELARHVDLRAEPRVIGEAATPALLEAELLDSAALGLPQRYALMVGTVEPRKGHELLIRALAEPEAPAIPLLIVGQQGWGGIDPQRLAGEIGVPAERVRLLGRLSDRELATAMRRASVLAMPSLAEGFGLPLLEALALGIPVVHSPAPALVEVAGGAGICVDSRTPREWARALGRVLSDEDLRVSLQQAGKTRARRFSWTQAARQVWELHREVRG